MAFPKDSTVLQLSSRILHVKFKSSLRKRCLFFTTFRVLLFWLLWVEEGERKRAFQSRNAGSFDMFWKESVVKRKETMQ